MCCRSCHILLQRAGTTVTRHSMSLSLLQLYRSQPKGTFSAETAGLSSPHACHLESIEEANASEQNTQALGETEKNDVASLL